MLKFDETAYMPLVQYETLTTVALNSIPTTFKHIESIDKGSEVAIKTIYIDIPAELLSSTVTVELTGLKNPNYVSAGNTSGSIQVQVLGGSLSRWETRAEAVR